MIQFVYDLRHVCLWECKDLASRMVQWLFFSFSIRTVVGIWKWKYINNLEISGSNPTITLDIEAISSWAYYSVLVFSESVCKLIIISSIQRKGHHASLQIWHIPNKVSVELDTLCLFLFHWCSVFAFDPTKSIFTYCGFIF